MNKDSSIALLAQRLRADAQRLSPGERLPSSRALTERYRVSPVTVSRALALLTAEGVVVTRPGSGTFVSEHAARRAPARPADFSWQSVALGEGPGGTETLAALLTPPPADAIALSGGYLPLALQPLRALAAASARAARRPYAWQAPPLAGLPELRAWFAAPVGAEPSDVLVAGGGQAALSITLRAVLRPGEPLLVESPTYQGAITAARAAGLRPVPVPMDRHGVRPDLLAEAFARTGARAFYCQPTFHNPTGTVLAPGRRAPVLAAARAAGAFVIEDDFARHLALAAPPPPLAADDAHGTVVHLASLTKATVPSLRIAGITARGPVGERLRACQLVDSYYPARPLQETALELVTSPAWPRHLRAVSAELRARRDALALALAVHLPEAVPDTLPGGGMHMWVGLPRGTDDVALADAARAHGVTVGAGRPYYPAEPPAPRLRLSYNATPTAEDLAEGVRRLARALRSLPSWDAS
ncbi:aminotransferase-like domain-containing protein [Actinocorallia populi]|uniref:aminotransferase-like domain-containing protein n=1 Tax=Actinocorallia populi TaxID=2079200 RepID=UPI000D0879BB|nr:PLP-dependent aminotransferase family protein [Actinocorallia populi]